MAIYSLSRSSVTMNTSNDMLTVLAGASRKLKVLDLIIGGTGATSAAAAYCEVGIFLSTGGTTGGGALTPKKWETDEPTQTFTNFTTWSAQPTTSGDPYYRFVFNNYGGVLGKPIKPIGDLIIRNSEQLSIRPVSGTSVVTFTLVVDEL